MPPLPPLKTVNQKRNQPSTKKGKRRMTAPLELIVAMMPYSARITLDGQAPTRSMDEADATAVFTVQVAARMAEEAIRLASEPERGQDRAEVREEIKTLLKSRLSSPAQRAALIKGIEAMQARGLVGITPDATLRPPDPDDDALVIVEVADILAIIEEVESQT